MLWLYSRNNFVLGNFETVLWYILVLNLEVVLVLFISKKSQIYNNVILES